VSDEPEPRAGEAAEREVAAAPPPRAPVPDTSADDAALVQGLGPGLEVVSGEPGSAPAFPASVRQLPLAAVPELLTTVAAAVALDPGAAAAAEPAPAPAASAGPHAVTPALFTPGLVVLSALFTLGCLMFVLVEPTPRWVALLGAGVVAFGMDGVLRAARREPFARGADTTPFLFLPVMFAFAAPAFIEYSVRGFWVAPVAAATGAAFALVLAAEVASVRALERWHAAARFVAAAATYAVVFALCALTYLFELELSAAVLAVGLVGVLLAVELLREGELEPTETLGFAAVTGVVLAESRWVLHYLPLDGYAAGLALVIVFYFAVGLVHAYVTRHLTLEVAGEYATVAAGGLALVVAARATGLA
jgi:hypothetical protein